jgi:hypothetical protein
MAPILDDEVDRYRCVLMGPNETVLDAIAVLRDEGGQNWWHLVVELGEGSYAAGTFSALAAGIGGEKQVFLARPLHDLVGTDLQAVEVVVEQDTSDFDTAMRQAAGSASGVAVVRQHGEFRGVLAAGGTRAGGLFDVGVIQLAGQYAELPQEGLLSRRRMKPRKKGAAGGAAPPGSSTGSGSG